MNDAFVTMPCEGVKGGPSQEREREVRVRNEIQGEWESHLRDRISICLSVCPFGRFQFLQEQATLLQFDSGNSG